MYADLNTTLDAQLVCLPADEYGQQQLFTGALGILAFVLMIAVVCFIYNRRARP